MTYVPCSSCMHGAFGEVEGTENPPNQQSKEIGYHLNGGFNKHEILKQIPSSASHTSTVSEFEAIIQNLATSDCLVTNSYHGAYWASLLGKKVVCIKTDVPKWDGLHEYVVFTEVANIERAIKLAKPVPIDYREECRSINLDFFNRIKNEIEINPMNEDQEPQAYDNT